MEQADCTSTANRPGRIDAKSAPSGDGCRLSDESTQPQSGRPVEPLYTYWGECGAILLEQAAGISPARWGLIDKVRGLLLRPNISLTYSSPVSHSAI